MTKLIKRNIPENFYGFSRNPIAVMTQNNMIPGPVFSLPFSSISTLPQN